MGSGAPVKRMKDKIDLPNAYSGNLLRKLIFLSGRERARVRKRCWTKRRS
jgi:hypothetical protein